jgi:hypothetical protein
MHSHQEKAVVKFVRDVQPDMIRIHDLQVQIDGENGGLQLKSVRIQGMRDNEFILDKAEFSEKLLE